jgi:hypothetical protein
MKFVLILLSIIIIIIFVVVVNLGDAWEKSKALFHCSSHNNGSTSINLIYPSHKDVPICNIKISSSKATFPPILGLPPFPLFPNQFPFLEQLFFLEQPPRLPFL